MNGSEPPLVLSVMKNVITMDDMGKEDGEPRSASKNGSQWAMA
jgi:hypothetical protein